MYTFYEVASLWRSGYLERRGVSKRVYELYWDDLNRLFFPRIGSLLITDVTTEVLDSLVDELLSMGYLVSTTKKYFGIVKSVIRYAYRKGYIDTDPIERMDKLSSRRRKDGIRYFTPLECKLFLNALEDESLRFRAFYTVAMFSGARRGEICALKWEDLDYDNLCIRINRGLQITHNGVIEVPPKTESSIRSICLPRLCFDLFDELKKASSSEYIFAGKDGGPMSLSSASTRFNQILRKYNKGHSFKLPLIRLHNLRHTAATLLVSSGVDVETVARRLGHASASMTLNIYAHPTNEADRRASCLLEELLGAKKL